MPVARKNYLRNKYLSDAHVIHYTVLLYVVQYCRRLMRDVFQLRLYYKRRLIIKASYSF